MSAKKPSKIGFIVFISITSSMFESLLVSSSSLIVESVKSTKKIIVGSRVGAYEEIYKYKIAIFQMLKYQ